MERTVPATIARARDAWSSSPATAIELLRRAVSRAPDARTHRALAAPLCDYLLRSGEFSAARDAARAALERGHAPADADALQLRLHVAAALLHLGDRQGALREALDLETPAHEAGDVQLAALSLEIQCDALSLLQRHEEARAAVDRALLLDLGPDEHYRWARLHGARGRILRALGEQREALRSHLDAVRRFRAAKRPSESALELTNVAILCVEIGAEADAVSYAEEALTLARASGERHLLWGAERALSFALQHAGREEDAVEHARALVDLADGEGREALRAATCERLGSALVSAHAHEEARSVLEEGVALAAALDDPWCELSSIVGLVEALVHGRDEESACAACERGWELVERVDDPALRRGLHRVSALSWEAAGDPSRALLHTRRLHDLEGRRVQAIQDARLDELRRLHHSERSERQLRNAFEGLPEAVLLVRRDGTIVDANSGAAAMFRLTLDELRSRSVADLAPQESRDLVGALVGEFFAAPRPRQIPRTLQALRADGATIPVEIALGLVRVQDETLAVCSIRDVSKLRRAEADLRAALDEVNQLRRRLERENVILREQLESRHGFEEIVGNSTAIRAVLRQVEQVAPTDATVLLLGETGTGKELFARAIHARSRRKEAPLVTVNCAALPESLIESELFGHVAGSFTGALGDRTGRFEMADGGTIFLDEVGDLPLTMQAKLLRVLQSGELQRIGSGAVQHVDVRVLAATNRDLQAMVAEGRFRADLYYRLNVFPMRLPALRERAGDTPMLVWFFVEQSMRRIGKRIERIPDDVMARFRAYAWPGNVRELQNVVERAVILAQDGVLEWNEPGVPGRVVTAPTAAAGGRLEDVQRAHVLEVLERCGWRVKGAGGAADVLGVNASTLRSRMRKLGIERPGR